MERPRKAIPRANFSPRNTCVEDCLLKEPEDLIPVRLQWLPILPAQGGVCPTERLKVLAAGPLILNPIGFTRFTYTVRSDSLAPVGGSATWL